MSKEKGILFKGEMVRANLEGRKTQTRRGFPETKPCEHLEYAEASWRGEPTNWIIKEDGRCYCSHCGNGVSAKNNFQGIRVPWMVGDTLYVREAFWSYGYWVTTEKLTKSGKNKREWHQLHSTIHFCADHEEKWKPEFFKAGIGKHFHWRKMSSLFLKKSDVRLWLKVTNVRVERLLDISEADAIAEGILSTSGGGKHNAFFYDYIFDEWTEKPIRSYMSLWDKINGEDSHCLNPWVWVLEFEVIDKP